MPPALMLPDTPIPPPLGITMVPVAVDVDGVAPMKVITGPPNIVVLSSVPPCPTILAAMVLIVTTGLPAELMMPSTHTLPAMLAMVDLEILATVATTLP